MTEKRKGGRPKGLPKSGGRKKGTPNKDRKLVLEQVQAAGLDLVEGLVRVGLKAEADGELSLARQAYSDLMPYCYPRLRHIDHSHEGGSVGLVVWNTGVPVDGETIEPAPEPVPVSAPPKQLPQDDKSAIESLVMDTVMAMKARHD